MLRKMAGWFHEQQENNSKDLGPGFVISISTILGVSLYLSGCHFSSITIVPWKNYSKQSALNNSVSHACTSTEDRALHNKIFTKNMGNNGCNSPSALTAGCPKFHPSNGEGIEKLEKNPLVL